ncbi:MAG: hydroxyacylglutathione hydrolase [Lentisphaeraceae bacterium]|nr:hydroxyacylglutathione hydrolase [Lentisphaeraceae bacterium]
MNIVPIPAFQSNYLWSIQTDSDAAIVDPGDATPVLNHLQENDLELKYILITHHHPDHVGGIRQLKAKFPSCKVYGPASENIPMIDYRLKEKDVVDLASLGKYKVLDIPGHTSGHIAYHDDQNAFVGDTVFAAGCGRLFEGTPAQMINSFDKIKKLAPQTKLFCAHEYTMSNIDFALAVEPTNTELLQRKDQCSKLREQGIPTIPSTLEEELTTNPFLRCHLPQLQEAASVHLGRKIDNEIDTFATIRKWKDSF